VPAEPTPVPPPPQAASASPRLKTHEFRSLPITLPRREQRFR
jgi:hypothetical protein